MTCTGQYFESSTKFSFVLKNYLSTSGTPEIKTNASAHKCPYDYPLKVTCCESYYGSNSRCTTQHPYVTSCELSVNNNNEFSNLYVVISCGNPDSHLANYVALFSYSIINTKVKHFVKRSLMERISPTASGQEYHVSIADFPDKDTLKKILYLDNNDVIEIVCEVKFERNSDYSYNELRNEILKNIKPCKNVLNKDLEALLENQKSCDVKLITRDEMEIGAHKAILVARSSVFSSMFEHDMREHKENIVKIEDFDHVVLKAALRYIYTGLVDELEELTGEILPFAEKYNIACLKDYCEDVLIKNLDTNNAVEILILSDMCNANRLKAGAESFIISKGRDIVKMEVYGDLKKSHPHLVMEICDAMLAKN